MRHGELRAMPDVQLLAGPGRREQQALPRLWTYFQAPGAILQPSGELLLLHNGGGPQARGERIFPESDWMIRYPAPGSPYWARPEHVNLWSGDEHENETGLFGVCQTPATWPTDRRWLLAWSGAWAADWGLPKAYRVWCGLATSPTVDGLWTRKQAAIPSTRRIPQQPAPNQWYPNGTWAISPLCLGGRVLCVVRDNSYAAAPSPRHIVYQVEADLSARLVGTLHFAGEIATTWATDAALGADGRLYVLEGGDPSRAGSSTELVEHATAGAWGGAGDAELEPTGRRYRAPAAHRSECAGRQDHGDGRGPVCGHFVTEHGPGAAGACTRPGCSCKGWVPAPVLTWDGGYLRTPAGGLVEPRLLLANTGTSGDWTERGDFRLQFWDESEDGRYTERLAVEPLPYRLGPRRELEQVWLAVPFDLLEPRFLSVRPAGPCSVRVGELERRIEAPIDVALARAALPGAAAGIGIATIPVAVVGPCWAEIRDQRGGRFAPDLVQRLDDPARSSYGGG